MLGLIAREPRSVSAVAQELPVSRPAVSQHLRVLLSVGLAEVRPRGRERIYFARLDGLDGLRQELAEFWGQALASFKRLAEATYDKEGSD